MITGRIFSPLLRCVVLLASILVAGALPITPALSQSETPKQFLQGIYKHYAGKGAGGVDLIGRDKASLYFDETLTDLLVKDQDESKGELGRFSFDPFVNGQDFSIRNVEITVAPVDENHAKATASFRNFDVRSKVNYDLVRTARGWRISNISWPNMKETFLSIMSEPLP